NSPAVVAAGPTVGVRLQVAAHPLAGRDRAAGVATARSGQSAGVAVAGLAGRQTLILLFLVCAFAKRLAGIDLARPRRFEAQRAEDGTSEDSTQTPQRFAARHGLAQRFGEFVEQVVHDGFLSLVG